MTRSFLRAHFSHRLLTLTIAASSIAWGWGGTAHRFINRNAVVHLPSSMSMLATQQAFLESHASDADSRKSVDTAESAKHFIDLEVYPDYQHLPRSIIPLVMQYGWTVVKDIGILPWATMWTLDSLTAQFRRGDFNRAYQTAADLGHYVGDAHQPLHCTLNYDGAQTGNNGIHSRYETSMINAYQSSLSITRDSARYVQDPFAFIMEYTLHSHGYVDSILQADNAAKAVSGWNGSGTPPTAYYATLWNRTRSFTTSLLQRSTTGLASLWYTAWVNATTPLPLAVQNVGQVPTTFGLEQNFPNPFNPSTIIRYQIPMDNSVGARHVVRLQVFDLLGREVALLVNERKEAGAHHVTFDATGMASGVYLYRLSILRSGETESAGGSGRDARAGEVVQSRRMILLR